MLGWLQAEGPPFVKAACFQVIKLCTPLFLRFFGNYLDFFWSPLRTAPLAAGQYRGVLNTFSHDPKSGFEAGQGENRSEEVAYIRICRTQSWIHPQARICTGSRNRVQPRSSAKIRQLPKGAGRSGAHGSSDCSERRTERRPHPARTSPETKPGI